MALSDVFVLYDNVQYVDQRWINRNRILLDNTAHWLTFPVLRASHLLPINARQYVADARTRRKLLATIHHAYRRSPQFRETFPLIESLFAFADRNVARFNENVLRTLAHLVGLQCKLVSSSSIDVESTLLQQARVIEICRRLGATHYLNSLGGVDLYSAADFDRAGLRLSFIQPLEARYLQFRQVWVPFLSIIDVLMFNPPAQVGGLLTTCRVLSQPEARHASITTCRAARLAEGV